MSVREVRAIELQQPPIVMFETLFWRRVRTTIVETFRNWDADNVSRLSAALSCYAIICLAPFGILSVAIAGTLFGQAAAHGQIVTELHSVFGSEVARAIEMLIVNCKVPRLGSASIAFGVAVLVFGASSVFVELQSAMNLIWKVPSTARSSVFTFIRQRIASFLGVLAASSLLLVSLVLNVVYVAFGTAVKGALPGGEFVWHFGNVTMSVVIATLLFALVFRVVPDTLVTWKSACSGAFVTALLFTLGKVVLGFYVAISSMGSPFGVTGSLVAVVIWIYYSSQILFLGAEYTAVASRH